MSIDDRSIILLHGKLDQASLDELKSIQTENIFVLEGRPDLETSRYLAKELNKRKIKPTVITDNMAGFLFYKNLVREVWLAYQLLDPHGAMCRIGSLILAVLGKTHHVPVRLYPSQDDLRLFGHSKELFQFNGQRVAPAKIKGYVPLVEWVPGEYLVKNYESRID